MLTIVSIISTNLLISVVIYFSIISILIIYDRSRKDINPDQSTLSFEELIRDYSQIPPLISYTCRDGASLHYRDYLSESNSVLVLLHGSGWHSEYLFSLADYLSSENIATVYTPDLRGHGTNPGKRGDIRYIKQFEDDIADFLQVVMEKHPGSKLIIGGHSSGGGLALRFAGSKYGKLADAFLLLSPYLKYNAPTVRLNSGGWAAPHTPRIIGLTMLNNIGITLLNHLPVIDFNMPEKYRNGTETLRYSFRLNTGFAPSNYKKDFNSIKQKVLVLAGTSDESFIADQFQPEISKYKEDVNVTLIDDVTHMGIVVGEEVRPIIKNWIAE